MVMDAEQLFADLAERLPTPARSRRAASSCSDSPRSASRSTAPPRTSRSPAARSSLREGRADDGPSSRLDASGVLGAVPGRRVDVRARHGRAREVPRDAVTSSWPGSRCCARRSTGGRCTSPGRSSSATATASALDLQPVFRVDDDRARRSATSSPRRATCTSKGCSPKRRWRRCRRSSTPRSPRRPRTTARRGGRAPRTAGTRRASSGST